DWHGLAVIHPDLTAEEQNRRAAGASEEVGFGSSELEDSLPFEKELALFRKQQVEPRQVHLLVVGLDLREVGVVREIGDDAPREPIFGVEAELTVERVRGRRLRQPV